VRPLVLTLALLAACAGPRARGPAARAELGALAARGALADDPAPAGALAPIAARLDGARIIGLGRPLAGAREFARTARALLRALVARHALTGLVLDIDVQLGLRLNDWANGRGGDLDSLLLELDEPAMRNADVRALLAAVREHNESPDRKRSLTIHGTDPGEAEPAVAAAIAFLRAVDPGYADEGAKLLRSGDARAVAGVIARLDARRGEYADKSSPAAFARARLQAEVAAQVFEHAETWAFDGPEFHRARNVDLALQFHGPAGKLLLWAENRRVAADVPGQSPSVGEYLRRWHGPRYVAIGGVFVRGDALLEQAGPKLCPLALPPARSGSFDGTFADVAAPAVLAVPDILKVPALERALRRKPVIRAIEGVYDPVDAASYVDVYKKLDTAFDALLVAPTVSAAAPAPGLGRTDAAGCVELL
jgi:erythromycin esterase